MNDRTRVYIDGFNLYYGCLKGTPFRWLDIAEFCRHELPNNDITLIRYFTAPVILRPNKPRDSQNQQTYLRALETLPNVQIHLGHFLEKRTRGRLVDPATAKVTSQIVEIEVPEEKGTDVNLATYLLFDAVWGMYDVAVVISNDTDLVEPISITARNLELKIGVLSPFEKVSWPLRNVATFYRPLRRNLLTKCQLPTKLTDANGTITKPNNW